MCFDDRVARWRSSGRGRFEQLALVRGGTLSLVTCSYRLDESHCYREEKSKKERIEYPVVSPSDSVGAASPHECPEEAAHRGCEQFVTPVLHGIILGPPRSWVSCSESGILIG